MLAKKKSDRNIANAENKTLLRYLTFFIGSRLFAVNLLAVKEILEYADVTDIPKMPKFIRGAINLRGKIIPVIDLSVRLGYENSHLNNRTCIIVVEMKIDENPFSVGVIVDSVNRVMDLGLDQVEEAPSFGGKVNTDFIEGMGKVEKHFVVILDIQHVLSLDDLGLLQDYLTEHNDQSTFKIDPD